MRKEDRLSKEMSSGLRMNINAVEKTWFRIVGDKSDTAEYLLNPDQTVEVKSDSIFEFLIGRADGLQIVLNGRDLGVVDKANAVVRYMLVDSSGIVVKLLKSARQDSSNEN